MSLKQNRVKADWQPSRLVHRHSLAFCCILNNFHTYDEHSVSHTHTHTHIHSHKRIHIYIYIHIRPHTRTHTYIGSHTGAYTATQTHADAPEQTNIGCNIRLFLRSIRGRLRDSRATAWRICARHPRTNASAHVIALCCVASRMRTRCLSESYEKNERKKELHFWRAAGRRRPNWFCSQTC